MTTAPLRTTARSFGVVNAKNTDFGFVDDWRCTKATKAAEAGDGEGGTSEVFNACFSISSCAGDTPISVADCQMSMASTCLTTGTKSPRSVCVAMPRLMASWRVTTLASSSYSALHSGAVRECLDKRLHDEGQVGEFWCSFGPSCVEVLAKFFQSGDIHFFKVREVRDGASMRQSSNLQSFVAIR